MSEEHNNAQEEFIIPIDQYIEEFRIHLESHPRTLFSAKFGDGKSYFLNKIKEHKVFKDYTFLTIHPINYQVESNKDIFELVKRDILLQMIANKMIDSGYEIPDSVAIQFFVQNNISTVAEFFISSLGKLNADSKLYGAFTAGYSTYNFIGNLKAKLNEYKTKGSDEYYMERFFSETSKLPSIEYDAISKIISYNIKKYQEDKHKKVVLIFEDMDRIDPAHLFRIMNVLSAQMDLPYITKENPNETLNKYGFDNIVLVLDYDNLKNLYHHFYGLDTSFDGYISKFSPRGYFPYSFKKIYIKYIYDKIISITNLPDKIVRLYIKEDFLTKTNLRRICDAIQNIDSQLMKDKLTRYEDNGEFINVDILYLAVIMRRIGVSYEEMLASTQKIIEANNLNLKWFPCYFFKRTDYRKNLYFADREYGSIKLCYNGLDEEGHVLIGFSSANGRLSYFDDYKGVLDSLLELLTH